MRMTSVFATLAVFAAASAAMSADRFTVEETKDGAIVKLDGKLFTRYQKLFRTSPSCILSSGRQVKR